GRFSHANTTARAFEISAALVGWGLNVAETSRRLYRQLSPNVTRLHAEAMLRLRYAIDGRVAYLSLPYEVFEATHSHPIDTQEFADIPRSIRGVEVGVFFRQETADAVSKVSLRSNGDADVRRVAKQFGGGGHVRAAGCTLACGLPEAEERILKAVADALTS
ncbi:MAG: bifunctional oligoribonuclease/PAP phosphatase NrnA, partial [Planctomycetes bacterium]|nr:bifunctional oligoribonuclease/PAP phosphatase NrnA [Planctomycetota bacterium]